MIKIPTVLVLRINLGIILPFLELLILTGQFMFSEEIYENILIFFILSPNLQLTGAHRPQIVIKIHMILLLRINFVIKDQSFLADHSYLQLNLCLVKKYMKKIYFFSFYDLIYSLQRPIGPKL